jgi:aminoglycoside/choline kinase family phosphotransferase
MDERRGLMLDWLQNLMPVHPSDIAPASDDASFRRYFRICQNGDSYIVMDAPPDRENCDNFIVLAEAFHALGLRTPRVLEADLEQGFLLLTDLGERQYLTVLDEFSADNLYGDALESLTRLQLGGNPETDLLPPYDEALLHREVELFREWFLGRHLGLTLEQSEHRTLDETFALLVGNALEQPRVWVHRDYHSRNLMMIEHGNPGVLDFQDAVVGPITYDLVSLLRDCYIAWPRRQVEAWALDHRDRLRAQGAANLEDADIFLRWFDLMGIQRHLKAIGIFARLHIRDGKSGYLRDIPRTLNYIQEVSGRYPELFGLRELLRERKIPS